MDKSYRIFDRPLIRRRQANRCGADENLLYLFREGAAGLKERLLDINRDYASVLTLGPLVGEKLLRKKPRLVVQGEVTAGAPHIILDEEQLPFREHAFDLVLSNLTLHWVNDLPGALIQARRALKPDGLFLAALLGGETLKELRQSLLVAEVETTGGASPRISPFADLRDAGDLLARAGFAMPVADLETLHVTYDHPLTLMRELRAMGENNALMDRSKTFFRKETLERASQYYIENFSDDEGRITASFQFLCLTAWAPGPNQPKPLRPGSGKVSLKQVLKP